MHPALFRRLLELRLITPGMAVEAQYEKQNEKGKMVKNKGLFNITRMYSSPFAFNTIIELQDEVGTTIEVDYLGIKQIEGVDPATLGLKHGIRADGMNNDAPKRRGRKPKVRPEAEIVDEEEDEEEDYTDVIEA